MQQYSAKELFSDWYSQGLKKDISSEELTHRTTSIDNLLGEKDNAAFWFDILKLCFKENIADESKMRFTTLFKNVDANFPVQNNDNVIQTLACCAVAQKIQINEDLLSDSLAIACMTNLLFGKGDFIQIKEFLNVSENFFVDECGRKRAKPQIEVKVSTQNLSKIEFKQGPGSAEVLDEIKAYFGKVSKDLQQLYQNQGQLQKLETTVEILSEESNVLWWLFGSYSRDKKSAFSTIVSYPEAVLRIGKELADLTEILPGLANVDSILSKAIMSNLPKPADPDVKFSDLVNSVLPDLESGVLSHYEEILSPFTPFLSTVKLRSEFSDDKDVSWQKLVASKYKINPNGVFKPLILSKQIYLEIMLSQVFRSL